MGAGLNGTVSEIFVYRDTLYAGGVFGPRLYFSKEQGVVRWNGAAWDTVGTLRKGVEAFYEYNASLFASFLGDSVLGNVAYWSGSTWRNIIPGPGMWGAADAMTVYEGALIIGGHFGMDPPGASDIARWDGHVWSLLGTGTAGNVLALSVYDGCLIAGTGYPFGGEVGEDYIAAWDGHGWHRLGTGTNMAVYALTVFNNALIVGGDFTVAGGDSARFVARWE